MNGSRPILFLRTTSGASGQSLVIAALFMVVLFGFAALSIDISRLYVQKKKLQNATDAAALAAAMELPPTSDFPLRYDDTARSFANANQLKSAEIGAVEVGHYDASSKTFNAGATTKDSVRVTAARVVPMSFAVVLGIKSLPVRAHSVAQVFASSSITVALPWVIEFDTNAPPPLCQDTTLRFVDLPNTGAWAPVGDSMSADDYRTRIQQGYESTLSVGDIIKLVAGMKTGPNSMGVQYRIAQDPFATCATVQNSSPRLVIVPTVLPGTMATCPNCTMPVAGFVSFFLTGVSSDGKIVYGQYHHVYAGRSVSRQPVLTYSPATAVLVE